EKARLRLKLVDCVEAPTTGAACCTLAASSLTSLPPPFPPHSPRSRPRPHPHPHRRSSRRSRHRRTRRSRVVLAGRVGVGGGNSTSMGR
ncbi:hypothetical protein M0804_015116, partial [Polistes exclamans]